MKNKLILHIFRKIKDNYKRFISLFCMSLLGVGFYAGIKATSPDMLKTLDNFYDTQNVSDIEIVSTAGLTDNDISALENISDIEEVYGTFTKDVIVNREDKESVIRLLAIDDNINKLYLTSGTYPSNNNEIIVEDNYLVDNSLKLGDTVEIELDDVVKEFTIVGTAISPLYFSTDRGSSTIGSGSVDYFFYILEDVIRQDYYTNIYIKVKNSTSKLTNSDEYNELIDSVITKIEDIKEEQEDNRYDELYGDIIEQANSYGIELDTSEFIKPTWYISDRLDIDGYKNLTDASTNIEKLGNIFPLVFYIIAVLVSLISMKRMIEEDRTENGTLKALGFNSGQITMKYLVYSFLATVTGGFLGMIIGFNLIPRVIWSVYELLFIIPNFICMPNWFAGIVGIAIALICIMGTAIIVSIRNLKDVPANLMRPKVPKMGRKIFLERIPIIWNKLKFSNKITIRNIFRYKSRVLATIIGIAGCTALILSGFGLRDSLSDIADYQFDKVFHYDKLITLKNDNYADLLNSLNENEDVALAVETLMETVDLIANEKTQEATLLVVDDISKLDEVLTLNDINSSKSISLDNEKVIVSDKTAQLLDINPNDSINLKNMDNKVVDNVVVSNIMENYVDHYVIMSKELYTKLFGEYKVNTLLINLNDISDEENANLNTELMRNEAVLSIIDTKDIVKTLTDMMDKLTSVVVILILAAAMLAFVVLYNLANINISERKREIATLKVLGFYHREVDSYITRETFILTIIGIALGLYVGLYLCHFIISTCEPDYIMFVRHINLLSYIYAILIASIFTIIVNIITHFNLKKINMIESLKNVE